MQQHRLLTVRDAAACLRVSERKVWDLLQSGQLRSVKLGSARRIPLDEIERLLERLLAEPGE